MSDRRKQGIKKRRTESGVIIEEMEGTADKAAALAEVPQEGEESKEEEEEGDESDDEVIASKMPSRGGERARSSKRKTMFRFNYDRDVKFLNMVINENPFRKVDWGDVHRSALKENWDATRKTLKSRWHSLKAWYSNISATDSGALSLREQTKYDLVTKALSLENAVSSMRRQKTDLDEILQSGEGGTPTIRSTLRHQADITGSEGKADSDRDKPSMYVIAHGIKEMSQAFSKTAEAVMRQAAAMERLHNQITEFLSAEQAKNRERDVPFAQVSPSLSQRQGENGVPALPQAPGGENVVPQVERQGSSQVY